MPRKVQPKKTVKTKAVAKKGVKSKTKTKAKISKKKGGSGRSKVATLNKKIIKVIKGSRPKVK